MKIKKHLNSYFLGIFPRFTQITRCHDYLRSMIAGSERERSSRSQSCDDPPSEDINGAYHYQEGTLDQERTRKNWANLTEEIKIVKKAMTEEIKVIKQEMTEMNSRMDRYATITLQTKEMLLDG